MRKKSRKIKGVDISALSSRQQEAMKKHSVHHTPKHIRAMVREMKKGASFAKSHKLAMKVGK